jgi:FXSXX-COOH protein
VGPLDGSAHPETDLIDVTEIDLEQLDALPDSVLAASVRRILEDGERSSDHYSAFQNAIP